MTTEQVRLSVVVITWNEQDDLLRCLDALFSSRFNGNIEVVVVDNGSTDGTAAFVADRYPGVVILRNPQNRGVTVARNQGMSRTRGRYIAMLDSDTEVEPTALETLCAFLDRSPNVGLVGPKLLNGDGTLQPSCRRIPSTIALLANRIERPHRLRNGRARRRYLMLDDSHDRVMDVDYVIGAAMVFRREAAATIGSFDERFGCSSAGGYGFDDADWALRLRARGWRVVYVPDSVAVHGYRRRLASKRLSRKNVGLAASYLRLRRRSQTADFAYVDANGAPGYRDADGSLTTWTAPATAAPARRPRRQSD